MRESPLASVAAFTIAPPSGQDRAEPSPAVATHARPDAVAPDPVAGSWDRLGEIEVPLLAMVGGIDSSDHRGMSARVADSVADGSLVTIPETAHYPNMERPADFDAAVRTFLGGIA